MDSSLSHIKPETAKEPRNYGLDLLKALAMIMVVTLHVLGHGGILTSTENLSSHYTLAWAFESLAYAAVDVYVIVTGYLYAGRQLRARNLVSLWLQVFFYSMLIPILLKLFGYDTGLRAIVSGFFPILTQRYWFFNVYFALFCFIPVLNAISENERLLHWSLLFSLGLFSVLPIFGLGADLFYTRLGSSFVWFAVLYLTGAYIKKHGVPSFMEKHGIFLFFLSAILLLLSRLILLYVVGRGEYLFFSYSSPLVFLSAVCIVSRLRNISIHSAKARNAVTLLSALSFDVYLIHDNPTFREHIMNDRFCSYSEKGLLAMAMYIIATVLVIFIAGEAIGFLRSRLFSALQIKKLSGKIGQALDAGFSRILDGILDRGTRFDA